MTFEIALNVARKMMRTLIMTGVIIVLSMVIMQFNRTLGILLMMIYSSWMMVKSSKNEMPLGKFTAILPGAMALLCFLFMMGFIGVYRPIMPIAGVVIGIIPGFLKARGHRIYNKDGKVYAKRTYFYILIWTGSLLFTQGSTLLGLRQITEFGFLLNGFSTTMAVILSVFLFNKAKNQYGPTSPMVGKVVSMLLPVLLLSYMVIPVCQAEKFAINGRGPYSIKQVGDYLFAEEQSYIPPGNISQEMRGNSSDFYDITHKKWVYTNTGTQHATLNFSIYYNHSKPENQIQKLEKTYERKARQKTSCGRTIVKRIGLRDGGWGMYFSSQGECDGRNRKHYWIHASVVWVYDKWLFELYLADSPYKQNRLVGPGYENFVMNAVARIQQRIKHLQVMGAVPTPTPKPPVNTQTSQETHTPSFADTVSELSSDEYLESLSFDNVITENDQDNSQTDQKTHTPSFADTVSELSSDEYLAWLTTATEDTENDQDNAEPDQETEKPAAIFEQLLSTIEQSLQNFGFSGGAVAAGVAVALIQLLAGLGMSATTTAAYEVAAAVEESINEGLQGNGSNPEKGDTGGDPSQSDRDTLIDENGERWESNDDGLFGVESENGETEWMTHEEAEKSIQEELDARGRRDQERDKFWEDVEKDKDARQQQRAQDLTEKGFVYDPELQAWVPYKEKAPYESKVEEMYALGDYVRKHMHELSEGHQKITERILDRSKAAEIGLTEEDIETAHLEDMKDLCNAISHITTGQYQSDMAQAEHDAIDQDSRIKKAGNLITAGKMAATVVESSVIPWSKGSISGAIYGGLESYAGQDVAKGERDWGQIVKNSLITSGSNVISGYAGEVSPNSVLWNASTGATVDGMEAWAKGKETEEIKTAMKYGFAMNGLFTHVKNVDQNGTHIFDFSGKPADMDMEASSAPTKTRVETDGPGSRATDISEQATDISTRGTDISSKAEDLGSRATDIGARAESAPSRSANADNSLEETIDLAETRGSRTQDSGIDLNATRNADQGFDPNATRHASHGDQPEHNGFEGPSKSINQQRTPASEEEVLQGIREHTAQNDVISRAEAASRGEPIQGEGREFPESGRDWNKWDQRVEGAVRSRMPYGINRTPVIQEAIDNGNMRWLDHVDKEVREAWRMSEISSPGSWERFEVELKNRNITMEEFEGWLKVSRGETPSVGADTVVPD